MRNKSAANSFNSKKERKTKKQKNSAHLEIVKQTRERKRLDSQCKTSHKISRSLIAKEWSEKYSVQNFARLLTTKPNERSGSWTGRKRRNVKTRRKKKQYKYIPKEIMMKEKTQLNMENANEKL